MQRKIQITSAVVLVVVAIGMLGWAISQRLGDAKEATAPRSVGGPAPVAVADITRGPIQARRVFSGTLESRAEFRIAPKVGGRIERLRVDLADEVSQGQVVAELDSAEFRQAVAQAEADLAVVQANLGEATSALEIADRELDRIRTLQQRGVASDSQFDTAKIDQLAKQARVEVARAQVTRAKSALETAQIRLGYTTVVASWNGEDGGRVVAERFVEEGDTVAANTPLMSIVELDPIQAAVYVTERDYARLSPGQAVTLMTDAFPGERFPGTVARVAPVFRQTSRQARVELTVPNPDRRLKPGMFVRAETVLERLDDAMIIPAVALVRRGDQDCVFVVDPGGATVSLVPVEVGIEDEGRVQIIADGLSGQVVTLGQQLLDDGSSITIPHAVEPPAAPTPTSSDDKPEASRE